MCESSNTVPVVTVNSAAICVGDSVTLTATSDAASPSYSWSPGGQTTASITVRRHTSIPFPLEMRLRLADGSVENVTIPVDIWGSGAERVTAEVAVRSNVVGARLWPDGTVPDWDDTNDTWGNAPAKDASVPLVTTGGLNTSMPRSAATK